MKIGKGDCVTDFSEDRGERRKEKKKKRSAGERRRAATIVGHASTVSWSNAAPARRRHVSPARPSRTANAGRAEPNRTDRPATAQKLPHVVGARAACDWCLPARVALALPAHCWRVSTRERVVLAWLLSICPIFVPVPVLILFLRE